MIFESICHRNLWFIDYNRIVRYNPADSSSRTYPAEEFFHPAIITLTNDGKPLFSDRQSLYTYKVETDNFQKIPFLNVRPVIVVTSSSGCKNPYLFVGTFKKVDDTIVGQAVRVV